MEKSQNQEGSGTSPQRKLEIVTAADYPPDQLQLMFSFSRLAGMVAELDLLMKLENYATQTMQFKLEGQKEKYQWVMTTYQLYLFKKMVFCLYLDLREMGLEREAKEILELARERSNPG